MSNKKEYYDYENQAWVKIGIYVRCGHPDSTDCNCYGKLHEGDLYITTNHIKRAIQYGEDAYKAAAERVPSADIKFMEKMIKGLKVKDNAGIVFLGAWLGGWDSAKADADIAEGIRRNRLLIDNYTDA